VTERRGLLPSGGQRLTRSAFRSLSVAERDEKGEPMQPRPVQVAECLGQLGVIDRGEYRDRDGRRYFSVVGNRGVRALVYDVSATLNESGSFASRLVALTLVLESVHPP